MAGELAELGFSDITELAHGAVTPLGAGLRVASYQYGFDDTAFVVAAADEVLVDVNDCKIRGRALEQIGSDFGPPTFMLKTHSWAQSYPNSYEADDPTDLGLVTRETYIDEFIDVARKLRPRYAVPFANMVAFLHPESRHLNQHMITPAEVQTAFEHAPGLGDTTLVRMNPGDAWSAEGGFSLSPDDPYRDRDDQIEALAERMAPKLSETEAIEGDRGLSFVDFQAYLESFMAALPRLVARRMLGRSIVFDIPRDPRRYWVLEFVERRVSRQCDPPTDRASLITVNEAVLADAIDNRILHFVHGSMRIRVALRPGGVNEDLAFWGLLMVWEIGYLPVSRLRTRRFLSAAWARRREAQDILSALRGQGSPLERLASGFAQADSRHSGE